MSRWTPCKRNVFLRRLRQLGFDGPFSGARHQFMVYQNRRLAVPSNAEFSVPQLRLMLHEVGSILERRITQEAWAGLNGALKTPKRRAAAKRR